MCFITIGHEGQGVERAACGWGMQGSPAVYLCLALQCQTGGSLATEEDHVVQDPQLSCVDRQLGAD